MASKSCKKLARVDIPDLDALVAGTSDNLIRIKFQTVYTMRKLAKVQCYEE